MVKNDASADALNGICPYYTMYPLAFPLNVLKRHGRKGDWILDPFCGRGTSNFAARLLGMNSNGIDSSPVAVALARAKLAYAPPDDVVSYARDLLDKHKEPTDVPRGEFWSLAFHPETLGTLCRLKSALARSKSSVAVLLRAIILGAMHGPQSKGSPSYFSNQSPRTFAPKPGYAVKFWRAHNLKPARADVLEIVARRAHRYLAVRPPDVAGRIAQADSRSVAAFANIAPPSWVITSPPYYGMRTYLPDQWLRVWFLGGPDRVCYKQPPGQLEHSGAEHFASQMSTVWQNVRSVSSPQTRMVVRFGGIHDRDVDPKVVLRDSLLSAGWRILTARRLDDADDGAGKRQVRQFQARPRKSIAEYDFYCRMA